MTRRQPTDPHTLAAINEFEAQIRVLESEERMLRQELQLPPLTERPLRRWTEQTPVPDRGRTRARRGPGRRLSITLTIRARQ